MVSKLPIYASKMKLGLSNLYLVHLHDIDFGETETYTVGVEKARLISQLPLQIFKQNQILIDLSCKDSGSRLLFF